MERKIVIWLPATFFLATVSLAQAQQFGKVPRIGILNSGSASTLRLQLDAFFRGLNELGYVEGKTVLIERRFAEGKMERLPDLAADLVRVKVDVIYVNGVSATRAAQQATKTVPIVVGSAGDLVRAGLVASLAKPGGNITGSTLISPDLSSKRLELLKEVVPKASRVALLWYPLVGSTDEDEIIETETAAGQFGVKVQVVGVRDPTEFQSAYTAMTKQRANAIIFIQGSFTLVHRKQLVELAAKHRFPTMCETAQWTNDGCLMNYGADSTYLNRRAATFVDKILKGRKPADLPIEQPMKYEFVVNLKTAKQIGLTIPPNVLARADRVIK
jgi:putative tryptophan/tyrosine transport system substrate-binding protein